MSANTTKKFDLLDIDRNNKMLTKRGSPTADEEGKATIKRSAHQGERYALGDLTNRRFQTIVSYPSAAGKKVEVFINVLQESSSSSVDNSKDPNIYGSSANTNNTAASSTSTHITNNTNNNSNDSSDDNIDDGHNHSTSATPNTSSTNDFQAHIKSHLWGDSWNSIEHYNIDEDVESDPVYCVEYINDIHENVRARQLNTQPRDYMPYQTDLRPNMRSILVDWIVDIAFDLRMKNETIFLAVNYLDRYLSLVKVRKDQFQMIGAATFLIACKYEEVSPPPPAEIVSLAGNYFTLDQLFDAESQVLKALNFKLTAPTIKFFLSRYLRAAATADPRVSALAHFYGELSLLEYGFVNYLPSIIAASCVYLALITTNNAWCVKLLWELHRGETAELTTIRTKYTNLISDIPTIGADFASKEVPIDTTTATLQLWDSASVDMYNLGRVFYRGSDLCVLCFDITNLSSFQSLESWRQKFIEASGNSRPDFAFIVVGCKSDLASKRMVSEQQARDWCKLYGDIAYFECSAKDSIGIPVIFQTVAKMVIDNTDGETRNSLP
eukprot:gene13706-16156_t